MRITDPTETLSHISSIDLGDMKFCTYGMVASGTAIFPGHDIPGNLLYPLGKLSGETGELLEKVFKSMRDKPGLWTAHQVPSADGFVDILVFSPPASFRDEILKECGDILWYLNYIVKQLDSTLEEVAKHNLCKLLQRMATNTIQGSGDNRETVVPTPPAASSTPFLSPNSSII